MDLSKFAYDGHQDAMRALLESLDLHVPGEAGHAERVAVYSVATAFELGKEIDYLIQVRRAASLHDIGKLEVDASIMGKMGSLTDEEFAEIKEHVCLAEEMLSHLEWMQDSMKMIRHHHERYDGQGYPEGLARDEIPLGARIICVAEAFDQMVSESGWREPLTEEEAMEELMANAGTQFDPTVVEAFRRVQPLIQPLAV